MTQKETDMSGVKRSLSQTARLWAIALIALTCFVGQPATTAAQQWTNNSNNNISNTNSGNVGVNTTTPTTRLHVFEPAGNGVSARITIQDADGSAGSLPGDVAMIYTIESEAGCSQAPAKPHIDVVTGGKLLPGKSVSFTVPLEDFTQYSKIFVEFDYSWELVNEERVRHEAVHRAYFLAIDLPRRKTAE